MNLKVGTRVDHERYGQGIVSFDSVSNCKIIFVRGGEIQFSKSNLELDIISEPEGNGSAGGGGLELKDIEIALEGILNKYYGSGEIVLLGEKWEGGNMSLQPANKDLKPKDIPIEQFFHKIVMLRDRLRVLEQNINAHDKLTDEDKVNLQQYITRCYGSLTTFNILFAEKDQYFVGQKG
jgi:hypothetical protein